MSAPLNTPVSTVPKPDEIRHEVGDDGTASGVEFEDTSGDERIDEPFDPDEIDVTTRRMTVSLLMSRLKSGALNLQPDFQRKAGIWDNRRQSRLIESLLLRIPLPSFYASENYDEEWEVVDGIQRLTAIARFISPELVPQEPLCLTRLEYLGTRFNRTTFEELPTRLKRRLLETEFTFHVIRPGTPDIVRFNIFVRINTGGMPLTFQELRHALVPGPARYILSEWAESQPFLAATNWSVRGHRMADREMVLRYLAFRLTSPHDYKTSDLNAFLIHAMKQVNHLRTAEVLKMRDEFHAAMWAAQSIFGKDAFRKRYSKGANRSPVNKALYEAVSVNLAELSDDQRTLLAQRKSTLKEGFITLMNTAEFSDAVSVATGDRHKVKRRFNGIRTLFAEVMA